MDVDGSAERRGPACGCGCCPRGRGPRQTDTATWSGIDKERVTRGRCMAPAWKKDRRVPVADPGRTAKEETAWKSRSCGGGDGGGGGGGGTGETQRELVML